MRTVYTRRIEIVNCYRCMRSLDEQKVRRWWCSQECAAPAADPIYTDFAHTLGDWSDIFSPDVILAEGAAHNRRDVVECAVRAGARNQRKALMYARLHPDMAEFINATFYAETSNHSK